MKDAYDLMMRLRKAGVKEIRGGENPLIVAMHRYGGARWAKEDEVPWCSSCINFVALLLGYERSNSASARSWLAVGQKVERPAIGDVVIFWRGKRTGWQGHVALYAGREGGKVLALGGNQSDSINVARYADSRVLGYRRLRKVD